MLLELKPINFFTMTVSMNLENKVRILTRGYMMKYDEDGNEIGTDQKEPVHIQSCTIDDKYYRLRGEANDLASELENSLDSLLQSYFNWNLEKLELLNRFISKNCFTEQYKRNNKDFRFHEMQRPIKPNTKER